MAVPSTRDQFKQYCLCNKYSKWYFNLMDRAMNRGWTKQTASQYVEGHHIIPRSISGDSLRTGLIVQLTAREHFIAHLILPKILTGKDMQKMQLALHRLVTGNDKNYSISSRIYNLVKKQHAIAASQRSTNYWASLSKEERSAMRSGEKNSRWGAVVSDKTRSKISTAHKGKLGGENHPLWGVGHSDDTKRKMSDDRKGQRQLHRWFNDGINQYYALPENAQPHWTVGALSHLNPMYGKVGAAAGKKWFHDPINKIQKYFIPGQQPAGFIQGRL